MRINAQTNQVKAEIIIVSQINTKNALIFASQFARN